MNWRLGFALAASLSALAAVGAQAGERAPKPLRHEPMPRDCPALFVNVPGTDACIRLTGQIRAETTLTGKTGSASLTRGLTRSRAESIVAVDVRVQTDYGPLRAYASVRDRVGGTPER